MLEDLQDLRTKILAANDLKREYVFVPQWGFGVYMQTLSGVERDAWEASIVQVSGGNGKSGKGATGSHTKYDMANLRARLVVKCITDEGGRRVFKDADAEALGKKSAAALDLLFTVAQRLNAVSEEDLDDLEKNSAIIQSDDSGSA